MQKIVIHSSGGYEKLSLESAPDLNISNDSGIIVQIHFSGINYADVIIRWGLYASAKKFIGWPITPGFEFSGVIKKVGSNVSKFKVGDKVFGCALFNAYASEIETTEELIWHTPAGWSLEQAAGMPATFLTAYHALFQIFITYPDSKILIHSASGGVGTALLQMCRLKGFTSVAVVGGPHKIETAKHFGANYVIDKSNQDLWREVKKISPEGYDVVLDANGASTLKQSFNAVALSGKLVIYGFHSMFTQGSGRVNYLKLAIDYLKTPRFHPLSFTDGNKSLITFNLSFLFDRKELLAQAMGDINNWIEQGQLLPPKVTTFQWREVGKAHQALESAQTTGKLILDFRDS